MNVDNQNDAYWSELSGTRAAAKLGITPSDPNGHSVFDEWFFWYYPYLADTSVIPWSELMDKQVLEVGLGYGSVGRKAINCGAFYTGLDVARGPIEFLSKTTQQSSATFMQESVQQTLLTRIKNKSMANSQHPTIGSQGGREKWRMVVW